MKWTCLVCGTMVEGETPPVRCPRCKVPAGQFTKEDMGQGQEETMDFAALGKDMDPVLKEKLRLVYDKQCGHIGVCLAMARGAYQEGYQEIGAFLERAAWEDGTHAAALSRLLGEVLGETTRENLVERLRKTPGHFKEMADLADVFQQQGQETVHAALTEMAEDSARRQSALSDLLARYF